MLKAGEMFVFYLLKYKRASKYGKGDKAHNAAQIIIGPQEKADDGPDRP